MNVNERYEHITNPQTLGSAASLGQDVGEEAARTADKALKALRQLLPTDQ